MADSLIETSWHRAGRHRWVTQGLDLRVTDGLPLGWLEERGTRFNPLADHPALFQTFASLPVTPDALREFADNFGLLGTGEELECRRKDDGELFDVDDQAAKDLPRVRIAAESRTRWQQEISAMRLAIDLWETLKRGRRASIAKLVDWESGFEGARLADVRGMLSLATDDGASALPAALQATIISLRVPSPSDAKRALVLVADPSDHGLTADGRPETAGWAALMRMLADRIGGGHVVLAITWGTDSRPALRLRPTSLLAALWLQFLEAVSGGKKYRRCEYRKCREWFEISAAPMGRRDTAEYCAKPRNCKLNEWRERERDRKRASNARRISKRVTR